MPDDAPRPAAEPPPAAPAAAPAGERHAARGAAMVVAGILLSRIAGLLRQRVSAHYFGTSLLADVLAAGFRVGNITQNLLGEGTLSASFIPVYAKLRGGGRGEAARHFALASLGALLALVAVVSVVGVLAAGPLTFLVAAGFPADKLAVATRITRIAFPMTGLLVVSAWALGVLNAHRRFFLPYAAPVLWSVAQIGALWLLGSGFGWRGEPLALGLAVGALVGAALQVVVLLPAIRGLVGGLRPRWDPADAPLREAASRLPGALVGRGIIQLSGLVDTLLVSFLGEGANAIFAYAQTLYLLPMSVLGTGEAAVALPEMAADTADTDKARRDAAIRDRLGRSLARVTVLAVPATVALSVFGVEIIGLLLQSGSFDRSATARVHPVLAAYSIALLGNASGRVLTTTCYALGDTRSPARFALYRVVVSTAVSLALMQAGLAVVGVVLGAVVAAWLETALLVVAIRRAVGGVGLAHIPWGRTGLVAALATGLGLAARWAIARVALGPIASGAAVLTLFGIAYLGLGAAVGILRPRDVLGRRRG